MGGILTLVLSLSMAATQDKPVAPVEQYKALLKEFGEAANANWKATTDEERNQAAARVEPLPLKLLELAEQNPNKPWTLDALTHVITQEYWLDNYSSHAGWGKDSRQARAIAILLRDHVRSEKLGEACKRAQFGFRQECEKFLRTVIEKNPHKDVQAQACSPGERAIDTALEKLINETVVNGKKSPQDQTLALVAKLGGSFRIDEKSVGKPVVMVDLSNTDAADDDLASLAGLPHLEGVLLRRTKVTDAGLAHLKGLTNLRELDVAKTKISDAGIAHLKGLKQLAALHIAHTQVTDKGLAIVKELRNLRELHLGRLEVTDAGVAHLKDLPHLQELHLSNTLITDQGLAHLQTSTSLQFLHIGHTKVSDAGLAYLAKLSKLQDLKLTRTAITDGGLVHLHNLSNLQRIELSDTKLSDAGVNALQTALPKVKILR